MATDFRGFHGQIQLLKSPPQRSLDGVPVIFQDVVPFSATDKTSRRRSGAKVQIGCNDLQGADLLRRLLHGSVLKSSLVGPASMGTTS
jgi:hypothetical protein